MKENKEEINYYQNNNNDDLTEYLNDNQSNFDYHDERPFNDNNNNSFCEKMCNDTIEVNSNIIIKGYFYDEVTKNDYLNKEEENISFKCVFKYPNSIINTLQASTGTNTDLSKTKDKSKIQINEIKPLEIIKTNEINPKQNIDENPKKELKEEKKEQTANTKNKRGRRKKYKKYTKKANHSKLSEDNIIRKIKTKIFSITLKKLNKSIKHNSGKFFPLTPKINVNLNKKLNMKLLNRTIGDIFANTDLNITYNTKERGKNNKNLIEKIIKENKETETIKILSMTFQDVLNEIRNNYLEDFLGIIQKKEVDNENKEENENEEDIKENIDKNCGINSYMNKAKRLLFKYEKWFQDKKGRNIIH